jgi:acetolactate synthase I/III small subunit
MKTYIIAMLVVDEPGVMTKISGMFARRCFNIDTITVGKTQDPNISRITITYNGEQKVYEQIIKQLNKMIDVIKVSDLPEKSSVIRELCLLKISTKDEKSRNEIINYANIYKNKIIDVTPTTVTIQVIGEPAKINAFLALMKHYGIKEIARTGVTGITRVTNSIE